ncbi:secreted RxLR effector protein 161-like [Schistocerca piceifrons]|uniref:secreted RxLR effector protein 161-like n=1 Tax=Schistocerca piceifrons TaxID=274613 RepID=UPI001F5EB686|nr:secreted RxLR effector protein 161-like [Schistocerca piceifrons]
MKDCNPAMHVHNNQVLTQDMSPETDKERKFVRNVHYREAINSFMYVKLGTRLDFTCAVTVVRHFKYDPGMPYLQAVKKSVRYSNRTMDLKLPFSGEENWNVTGYSDADRAGDKEDRQSVIGFLFKSQGAVISWSTNKQLKIALSITEAEYMAPWPWPQRDKRDSG